MDGKFCVVTGGTDGIGLVTATTLAERGARVLIVGRNPEKGASAAARIQQATGADSVEFLRADLSSQLEIRELAENIRTRTDSIDVLVNNAGAVFLKRQESIDGFEMTFALNQLGYFLLTCLVRDLLENGAPARIVNVSSDLHKGPQLDFDALDSRTSYSGFKAYQKSKLANLLFTRELAKRLAGTGVTANAVHPGYVNSNFGNNNAGIMKPLMRVSATLFGRTPEKGAQTSIYTATSPEVEGLSGKYFRDCKETMPSAEAMDDLAAARLWDICEQMTGIAA